MLCNKQAIFTRFWQAAQIGRCCTSSAAQCSEPLALSNWQCTQLHSAREFATDSAASLPDGLHGNEFPELRNYLEKGHSQAARDAKTRGEATELPIGGGIMPELPRTDTDASRLLGRKGIEALKPIKRDAQAGSLGMAVTAAIQQYQLTAPKTRVISGLNASEDVQELLERWDELLRAGDYDSLTQQMKVRPKDVAKINATFEAADEARRKAAEKAMRRQREEDIKAAHAASHIVLQDEKGRSYGTGKRKTSIARVWIRPAHIEGLGRIMVNGRRFFDYFGPVLPRVQVVKPFEVTGTLGLFDVRANVHGGGFTGQAEAIRHGISKALQHFAPELRPTLKKEGYLTRDNRIVERKKPGRKKARKAFQWVKR